MNYKQFTLLILIIAVFPFMIACKEGTFTDSLTGAEHITGLYESIVFTEPGELDGGIDILASGGMLTVNLSANFELEGHLLIPANIGSSFPPTDADFKGTFTLDTDTVHFKNTGLFLDHDPWMFIIKDNLLETPDWTGWWGATKIILEKQ